MGVQNFGVVKMFGGPNFGGVKTVVNFLGGQYFGRVKILIGSKNFSESTFCLGQIVLKGLKF